MKITVQDNGGNYVTEQVLVDQLLAHLCCGDPADIIQRWNAGASQDNIATLQVAVTQLKKQISNQVDTFSGACLVLDPFEESQVYISPQTVC